MNAKNRESGGGGKAPSNTMTSMKSKGAGAIKNSSTYKPSAKGLGMIKGAGTCPGGGGKNSKY